MKLFLKVMYFTLALKLASCKPVVVELAESIYDYEKYSKKILTPKLGNDDKSDGIR